MKKIRCTVTIEAPGDDRAFEIISHELKAISERLTSPETNPSSSLPMGWGRYWSRLDGAFLLAQIDIRLVETLGKEFVASFDKFMSKIDKEND